MDNGKSQGLFNDFIDNIICNPSSGASQQIVVQQDFKERLPVVMVSHGAFMYHDFDFGAGEVLEGLPERDSSKFNPKKKQTLILSDTYTKILHAESDLQLIDRWSKRAKNTKTCATFLQFNGDKLHNAIFCHVRLCPMCTWRRSLKLSAQLRKILVKMFCDYGLEQDFAFLTLTVPNVSAADLKPKINQMLKAWDTMTRSNSNYADAIAFNRAFKGYFRSLEITYNYKTKSYHPHLHIILPVADGYFTGGDYLNQSQLLQMWRDAMGDQTIKMVNIKKIYPNPRYMQDTDLQKKYTPAEIKALALISALCEVTKYAVKSKYYIDNPDVTRVLDLALERVRLVSYGGIIADIRKLLQLSDAEDGDLVHVNDTQDMPVGDILTSYAFSSGLRRYIRIVHKQEEEFTDDV